MWSTSRYGTMDRFRRTQTGELLRSESSTSSSDSGNLSGGLCNSCTIRISMGDPNLK